MNLYLIALATGGIMESKKIEYSDFQVISANTKQEALDKYNKINNCDFFYGTCMVENVNGEVKVLNNDVTYGQLESFKTLLV
jgi:hypothetical protein